MPLNHIGLKTDVKGHLSRLWRAKALIIIGSLTIVAIMIIVLSTSIRSNDRLPDFTINMYQGENGLSSSKIRFSNVVGQGKPVVLNFWAGLCPPCKVEMPHLQDFHDQHMERVLIIGVDVGPFVGLGSIEDGKALLKEMGLTYPVGTTFEREVIFDYQVKGLPSTYFFTSDGKLFRTWRGLLDRDTLYRIVAELMGETELSGQGAS